MRDFKDVLKKMIKQIPERGSKLESALQREFHNAVFRAPEDNIKWDLVSDILDEHIHSPTQDWEFELLSIFTTKPVDELRTIVLAGYKL